MIVLNLVRIVDTSGKNTGDKGKVTYQALTDKEEDNLSTWQGDASYIGWNFEYERLGDVQVPSVNVEDDDDQ